jgi:hypothetical protein
VNVSSLSSTSAMRPTGPPPGPPPSGGPEKTLQAVADKLGLDRDALKKALQDGSTMSSLAAQAGISQDDLVATIAATLPAQGPDGVAIDTTSMATGSRTAPGRRGARSPRSTSPRASRRCRARWGSAARTCSTG